NQFEGPGPTATAETRRRSCARPGYDQSWADKQADQSWADSGKPRPATRPTRAHTDQPWADQYTVKSRADKHAVQSWADQHAEKFRAVTGPTRSDTDPTRPDKYAEKSTRSDTDPTRADKFAVKPGAQSDHKIGRFPTGSLRWHGRSFGRRCRRREQD